MATLIKIEKDLRAIKERNQRVELDKAWETSWERKIIITLLTYIVMVLFFYFAGLPRPFINSIVPVIAFVLSTMSLDLFKKIWVNHKKK